MRNRSAGGLRVPTATRGAICIARALTGAGARWACGARPRIPRIMRGKSAGRWTRARTDPTPIVPKMGTSDAMAQDTIQLEKNHCPREFDFALVLDGLSDLTDEMMDKLFEAGCDDATFSLRYGRVFAEFSRTAATYSDAVLSAIRHVRAANVGADLLRVNECDLVSAADIARRIDRSRELVSQYISGGRGPGNFPPPECFLAEGKPLWAWCAVSYWLVENQLAKPEVHEQARFAWVVNEWLSAQRSRAQNPGLVSQVEAALAEPARE